MAASSPIDIQTLTHFSYLIVAMHKGGACLALTNKGCYQLPKLCLRFVERNGLRAAYGGFGLLIDGNDLEDAKRIYLAVHEHLKDS